MGRASRPAIRRAALAETKPRRPLSLKGRKERNAEENGDHHSQYNFQRYTFGKRGKGNCSPHHIREMDLMKIALDDIRRVTHSARTQERQFVPYINQKNSVELRQKMNALQKELDTMPAFYLYISPCHCGRAVFWVFLRLTHNLTQNRKIADGISGANRTEKDMFSDTIRTESAENICSPPLSAAHNPEVAGSSPAAATIENLETVMVSRFSFIFWSTARNLRTVPVSELKFLRFSLSSSTFVTSMPACVPQKYTRTYPV